MPSSASVRRSIRWLPGEATEPTHTVVLTGESGIFLDVRFKKDSSELDWAFAGYRLQVSEDTVQFKHHIDSRTLEPLSVVDIGTNTTLENGHTLECGEMVNPDTGEMTQYEEIWKDISVDFSAFPEEIFSKNEDETEWHAQVGDWRIALGRGKDSHFWAYQAKFMPNNRNREKKWQIIYATNGYRPYYAGALFSPKLA